MVYGRSMSAEEDAMNSLADSGLLQMLRWAAPVAFERTGQDYDDDAGHDQSIIGLHNFVYLRDLMDRAAATGKYALPKDAGATLGTDLVRRGIAPEAFASMPSLRPGMISRSDYKGSPGWAAAGLRMLLQSYKIGKVDQIIWGQRSPAKRRVASQRYIGAETLFADEDWGIESIVGIPHDGEFEGLTLVAAHALDPFTGRFEVFVGQSKNPERRGDGCWHWRVPILSGGTPLGTTEAPVIPALPGTAASTDVEEIGVTLKDGAARATGSSDA